MAAYGLDCPQPGGPLPGEPVAPPPSSGGGGGGYGGGGGGGTTSTSVLSCTIQVSNELTLSNLVAHTLPFGALLQEGSWGRAAADTLGGGNAVTGLVSAAITVFGKSASGKEPAQTGAEIAADPNMGLNPVIQRATGGSGIPVALDAVEEAAAPAAAQALSGIGLAKLGADLVLTAGSAAYCVVKH